MATSLRGDVPRASPPKVPPTATGACGPDLRCNERRRALRRGFSHPRPQGVRRPRRRTRVRVHPRGVRRPGTVTTRGGSSSSAGEPSHVFADVCGWPARKDSGGVLPPPSRHCDSAYGVPRRAARCLSRMLRRKNATGNRRSRLTDGSKQRSKGDDMATWRQYLSAGVMSGSLLVGCGGGDSEKLQQRVADLESQLSSVSVTTTSKPAPKTTAPTTSTTMSALAMAHEWATALTAKRSPPGWR